MTKDDAVPVTAEDRRAAASIYQRFRDHDYAAWILDGTNAGGDGDFVLQTLARHRGSTAGVDVEALRAATFWPQESRYKGHMRSDDDMVSVRVGDIRAALASLSQTPATPTPDQMVTVVVCATCGGEFDEGEWDADTRCPECEQPKRWNEMRTRLIGSNPLPTPTPDCNGNDTATPMVQEGLREALEPFASILDENDPADEDDATPATLVVGSVTDYSLTLGDLRAARRALSATPAQEGEQ